MLYLFKKNLTMKFLFILLICPIFSFAQVEEPVEQVPEEVIEIVPNEKVLDFVEVEPKFPGGAVAMAQFIQDNVNYPEAARENGEQGIVYIKFVVEKDGAISNVTVRKGVYESLNAEAMRVIKKMPNWIAGKQNSKPVRVNFTLPIHFRLASDSPDAPDAPKIPLTKKEQKKYDKQVKKAEKVKAKYLKKQQKNG